MIVNYGGCVINLKNPTGRIDLTGWIYTVSYPQEYQGEKVVSLINYVGDTVNVNVPTIN